jgi:hypothetical protein
MIKDLAGSVSVFVIDMVNPVLVVDSPSDSGDNIAFYNRERVTADYEVHGLNPIGVVVETILERGFRGLYLDNNAPIFRSIGKTHAKLTL